VVWFSDIVIDNSDVERNTDVIYESILTNDAWSEPTIVAELSSPAQPSLSSDLGGTLHMVWNDEKPIGSPLLYTSQIQYSCQDDPPRGVAQALYDVARSEKYRPGDKIVPYCQNRYERLLFTPAPDPAFSDEPALQNGGFDDYNAMINSAKFEVLFATMEYDEDINQDSPGLILANGITELYNKVAANPENYPRGMTVKIVLGNPPRMDVNTDLWRVLSDLRDAGLPEMVNEQIGWRLEIANYKGHMPHSHVKVLVIDGKTAISTGFNYQYHHYPEDHPSGAGEGTVDIGIQVTGPAAQEVLFAFDQLWNNSTQRYCSDLSEPYPLWQWNCEDTDAMVGHVPEVTRYYLADGKTQVFSMLRSEALGLSDEQIARVLANATERIDVMEAMFSMPLVCYLNHLFELCTFEQAMPYIESIIEAAENGAHVRLLLKMTPFLGTEAQIALQIMQDEVEKRGLEDRVEFRVFPVALHAKTFTIDEQVVIIGSQNLHYTAYWEGSGLVEHNLAVVDPEAVADYQRVFDYWWEVAGEK